MKYRYNGTAKTCVLPPQLQCKRPLPAVKNDGVIESWTLSFVSFDQFVPADQNIIGVPAAEDLYANQAWSDYDGMQSVDSDIIQGLKPREGTAIMSDEAAIRAEFRHRPAGFDAAQHVCSCVLLVFDGYGGLAIDACSLHTPAHARRQSQTA